MDVLGSLNRADHCCRHCCGGCHRCQALAEPHDQVRAASAVPVIQYVSAVAWKSSQLRLHMHSVQQHPLATKGWHVALPLTAAPA